MAKDATLIEILNGDNSSFDGSLKVAARTLNGKHILINNDFKDESINDGKTLAHEMGHTGGLTHVTGINPLQLFIIPYTNFMRQGSNFVPTGITKSQILRIFRLYSTQKLNNERIEPGKLD